MARRTRRPATATASAAKPAAPAALVETTDQADTEVVDVPVRNRTTFIRGLHDAHGAYHEFAPGQTRSVPLNHAEYTSAEGTGYFDFGKAVNEPLPVEPVPEPAAPPAPVTPQTDDLDKMSDADLFDTVAALTGERPAEGTDREALLALARGDAG